MTTLKQKLLLKIHNYIIQPLLELYDIQVIVPRILLATPTLHAYDQCWCGVRLGKTDLNGSSVGPLWQKAELFGKLRVPGSNLSHFMTLSYQRQIMNKGDQGRVQ